MSKAVRKSRTEEKDLNPWPVIVPSAAVAAAGIASWGAFVPSSQLFGPTLRHTPHAKKVALTFDDGPNPAITPGLLDLLGKYDAAATFFLIGRFARACPDLVREIAARGHVLGNHTDTHPNLAFLSARRIRGELARCQDAIADATGGIAPRWMRPPYGARSPMLAREVRAAGLRGVVMWSVIGHDWKPQPPLKLIGRLYRSARGRGRYGDIIVLHDGDHRALGGDRRHIIAALAHWLPRWRDAGLEFVTMDTMQQTGQLQQS